jgi:hypothetical protein
MTINKEKFADIENAFTRLKANESDVSALRSISEALHGITNKTIDVTTISPQSQNQECYVMSIYPEESTIDKLINAIVTEQNDMTIGTIWNDNAKWVVEIDTRMLQSDIGLSEKELTALLLHEVGHVIHSATIPKRIAKVVRFEYAKSNLVTKQLLKDNIFSKILCFPILNACNFNRSKSTIKNEIQADTYSVNAGYGSDLNSAIEKIIKYAGVSSDEDSDMKELTLFSMDTINQLQNRQNTIVRKNMQKMIVSTPSKFTKAVIIKVGDIFNGNQNGGSITTEAKDKYLEEKVDRITNEFYASEAFFNRIQKLKRIDPADIDYIALEVNNIKSNDDKMMIVSYIYSKLDTIDYYLALLDSKNPRYSIPHSRESLIQMRTRLEKYKDDAINRKLPEISYGITIQYPTGYEG